MPCDCEKARKEQDDNGGSKTCGDGQHFDDKAGKCVPNSDEKKKEALTDGDSTQAELPEGDPGEVQKIDPQTCPEGHVFNATSALCEPIDKKDPGIGQTQGSDQAKSSVESSIADLSKKIDMLSKGRTEKKPTAQVGDDGDRSLTVAELAEGMVKAVGEGRNYVFHIPLDVLRAVNVGKVDNSKIGGIPIAECYRGQKLSLSEAYKKPNKTLKEALTLSGTHATQDLDTDVAIVPGGISFIPVLQFAKVKEVGQGMDRARFFKSTIPDNASQTAGTTATENTSTITSVEVVPSQITGVYLEADYDLIENSPFDFLQTIVETSAASYDDFVATDMLTTVSAEGTLTPGLWISGESGATLTSSDVASQTFDETGIAFGREYLENQGYLRGGVKPVCCMHPKQWRQLLTSTNVTTLATRAVPDIYLKAQLEELMGVQIVVTNAVEAVNNQTNDAYNAYMFIPKHSYGIAIKRDVTVKFHDIGEDNVVRVNTTWRAKAGVIDSSSIVRISTTQ